MYTSLPLKAETPSPQNLQGYYYNTENLPAQLYIKFTQFYKHYQEKEQEMRV